MPKLIADAFNADPRIAQAKELLLATLVDHQKSLTEIRSPDPDLQLSYRNTLNEFGELRAGSLFYPYLGSGIGAGPLVELADGSIKYDFISGIGVHHWGHAHPTIVAALVDAALRDTVMQGNLQQNIDSADLAKLITSAAQKGGASLQHCFFTTSGAMANENALKIIFQKNKPAYRLLAFENCFAGRSLALSQVTDRPGYRQGLPPTLAVDYLPFFNHRQPEQSTRTAMEHLRRYLVRHPGEYAAMIFELVQGEGGFNPGDSNFFRDLMDVLRENNIAIMVDEIQTFGRTTELFAFQHFGLNDYVDVVTIGKLSQVCATLFMSDYKPGPGLLSQTFTASTSAIFASHVIVKSLLNDGYLGSNGKIAQLGDHFRSRLQEIEKRHPSLIAGPYGIGAMIAFTPFGGDFHKVKQFVQNLFDAGVIAFYCGTELTRVRFLIPVGAITYEHIDEVSDIVETTLVKSQ